MKKLLTIIATLCVCSSAYAVEYFFDKSVGFWSVYGHPGTNSLNPACVTTANWDDGSYLNLIQDLKDGELLIELKNNEWDVSDADLTAQYDMTLNMYSSNKSKVKSWKVKFNFLSKNTIQIRGLDYKTFLPAFINFGKMILIPPGTMPNAEISLENSSAAVDIMAQCLDASKTHKFDSNSTDGSIQKQGV